MLIVILSGAAGFGTVIVLMLLRHDRRHDEETRQVARQAADRAVRELLTRLR